VLRNFDELRLSAIGIEQKDSAAVRQSQTGRNQRTRGFLLLALSLLLRINFLHLIGADVDIRPTRILLVKLVGRVPVDEAIWNVFPVVALGAVEVHSIAMDLPLRGDLVGAIFEDEALALLLRVRRGQV